MAHFYASVKGGRSEQTCTGTKNSGMTAHIRGWNAGAEVDLYHSENGVDRVRIYITSGSNNTHAKVCLFDGTYQTAAKHGIILGGDK
jgi:hypothetical protein